MLKLRLPLKMLWMSYVSLFKARFSLLMKKPLWIGVED